MRDLCALGFMAGSWALIASGAHVADWRVLLGASVAVIGYLVIKPRGGLRDA